MTLPPFFQTIIWVLTSVSGVAGLACFVMAGLRLRAEGGVNYDAGGGFFKWLLWGAVFMTLPGIILWFNAQAGFPGITLTPANNSSYATTIVQIIQSFVNDILVNHLVPILAATLVVKAILDSAEGHTPIPSIVAALFLLGVKGIADLANGWNTGDEYSTTNVLQSMLFYLSNTICPMIGGLCICGAIFCYIGNRRWGHLIGTGIAFLCVPGIWALVKAMAGVSLSW
jgi:hypothetical protein